MPTNHDIEFIKVGFGMIITGILGLMGWFGRRQIRRIDAMEENAIKKEDYNKTVESLRREIAEGNKSTHSRLDQLMLFLAKK
jgi:hypothetical protein